ncbi:MAG TPA: undecaprenyl-diphosphate phosphatase [Coriobacteriia bacterium]|nr:undecaprenyl-diphosphate phosphatase [Coriobacteriia bacterium]
MLLLQAVVLGIVQGVTEFLPISSDGHLILVPSLLGWERFGLGFDVMLHAGTLLATVLYFRRDLAVLARGFFSRGSALARDRRFAWLVIGSAVPSVVVVLALEPFIDGVESRPVPEQIVIAALGLLATSVVLGVSEIIAARTHARGVCDDDSADLPWSKVLGIGFAQGFAALPGLSRSGTTIATGQALGMSRGEAARFSFLISVPIIAAATAKKLLDLMQGEGSLPSLGVTVVGVAVTTAVGYGVIWLLLPFVRKHSLWWFAAYTAVAGILLLVRYAL